MDAFEDAIKNKEIYDKIRELGSYCTQEQAITFALVTLNMIKPKLPIINRVIKALKLREQPDKLVNELSEIYNTSRKQGVYSKINIDQIALAYHFVISLDRDYIDFSWVNIAVSHLSGTKINAELLLAKSILIFGGNNGDR